jgi:hypothetical protein
MRKCIDYEHDYEHEHEKWVEGEGRFDSGDVD